MNIPFDKYANPNRQTLNPLSNEHLDERHC